MLLKRIVLNFPLKLVLPFVSLIVPFGYIY